MVPPHPVEISLRRLFPVLLLWMISATASFGETNYFTSGGRAGQGNWAAESFWSLGRTPESPADIRPMNRPA